jgi:hypothetical protein
MPLMVTNSRTAKFLLPGRRHKNRPLPDFHNTHAGNRAVRDGNDPQELPRKSCVSVVAAPLRFLNCTISGHRPVDELHSIETKGDKSVRILLTFFSQGVKTNSFFDSFQGFPVGR